MHKYDKPDNLVELWQDSVKAHGDNLLFGLTNKEHNGVDWLTYREIDKRVNNCRGGLKQLGVQHGDSVGIIASNRPEWMITAFATYGLGGRFVPMYEKELFKIWKYIIKDGEVKVLFVSNQEIFNEVQVFLDEIPALKAIYVLDGTGDNSLAALEKLGAENPAPAMIPSPNDTAGLIYTSGTTGDPKGVLLSHGSFSYDAVTGSKFFKVLDETDRSLSILPWAHSYGQTGELYNFLYMGASMGFMESVDTLARDFELVRPSMLIAVPRLFNKIYAGIWDKMDSEGGLKRKLFVAAVENAKKKRELADDRKSSLRVNVKNAVLDRIVFSKVRERFGGKLKYSFTASAVMNPEIANFFRDIGIPTYDGYGLTETAPCVSMNTPEHYRAGSVGKVMPGQRVVIDKSAIDEAGEDGEIVVYGPNVMQGYHNKPKETAAVMTEDGGFKTGDRGKLDQDGFLFITGRIKEQYKLSNGKYVFPSSIEEDIKLVKWVANAFVHGAGQAYNICVVVPDFEVLIPYAKKKGLNAEPDQIIQNAELTEMIQADIATHLRGIYGGYEIPKKFLFISEDFTLENGMLTQTMKLKRRMVLEKYKEQIIPLLN